MPKNATIQVSFGFTGNPVAAHNCKAKEIIMRHLTRQTFARYLRVTRPREDYPS